MQTLINCGRPCTLLVHTAVVPPDSSDFRYRGGIAIDPVTHALPPRLSPIAPNISWIGPLTTVRRHALAALNPADTLATRRLDRAQACAPGSHQRAARSGAPVAVSVKSHPTPTPFRVQSRPPQEGWSGLIHVVHRRVPRPTPRVSSRWRRRPWEVPVHPHG
jgi:hypothetical protein